MDIPFYIGALIHIKGQDCTLPNGNTAKIIGDFSQSSGCWTAVNQAGVVFSVWPWTHYVCPWCEIVTWLDIKYDN